MRRLSHFPDDDTVGRETPPHPNICYVRWSAPTGSTAKRHPLMPCPRCPSADPSPPHCCSMNLEIVIPEGGTETYGVEGALALSDCLSIGLAGILGLRYPCLGVEELYVPYHE